MAFILFRSQYQCGAILPADVCVEVVRRLYVWYYPVVCRVHPGCQGASCCVMLSRFLCIRLVSIYETLWWPMYGRCNGVCYTVVLDMCSVGANFLHYHFSLFTICLHYVWSPLVNTYHSYGILCYVVNIRADKCDNKGP